MLIRKLLNKICVYSLIGCFLMNPTVVDAKDKSYYDIPLIGPGNTLACALGEYSDIKDIYFNGYVKSPPHAHDDRHAYQYHSEESDIIADENWKYNISEELELEYETTDSSDGGYNGFPTEVYYDKAKNPVVKVYGDDIIKNPGYVLVDKRYIVYKLIYNLKISCKNSIFFKIFFY